MALRDILGHEQQVETLCRSLAQSRLHHAYLFLGPDGVGKKTIALSLAKAIHCAAGTDDFCGTCDECARIDAGNHPDVRVITPLAGKKEIGIQQIREIEKQLSFRSFSGRKKIVIVDPATLMNWPAQNALLKTLEEPPQDSLLILISASRGGLLPTLRSRCLSLSFGPLPRQTVAEYLVARRGLKPEEAGALAAMAMGSLGKAAGGELDALMEKRRAWAGQLCALTRADYRSTSFVAEALAGNRDETMTFLEWVEGWYRDLLVFSVTGDPQAVFNVDLMPRIQQHARADHVEFFLRMISRTVDATAKVHRNVNRRLVLENLLYSAVEAH